MALSGSEINKRIESLVATKTIYAQGLWYMMRRLIEHPENKRDGYLQRDGRPVRAEEITGEPVNASAKSGPKALRALSRLVLRVRNTDVVPEGQEKNPDREFPLIKLDKAGCIYSPALQYLHERLGKKAKHKATSEGREDVRGLRNPHSAGLRGLPAPVVTPIPPLEVSPPITPSSLSPPIFSGGDDERANGQPAYDFDLDRGMIFAGISAKLNKPAFRKAFEEWVGFQRQKAAPRPFPALSIRKALGRCDQLGHDRALAAIDYSIAGNYGAIIEPPEVRGANGHGSNVPRQPVTQAAVFDHRPRKARTP